MFSYLWYIIIVVAFVRTSWMAAEQVLLERQERANREGTSSHLYVENTLCQTLKHQGKFFPFSLVCLIFRTLTFSLTIACLGYHAIPLYAVLILFAIALGAFWNNDTDTFVIKGFKSVLFMGKVTKNLSEYQSDGPKKVR